MIVAQVMHLLHRATLFVQRKEERTLGRLIPLLRHVQDGLVPCRGDDDFAARLKTLLLKVRVYSVIVL